MTLSVSIELELARFDLRAAFEVGSGITTLFGPSGAGKSLTLRAIAGLTMPRVGRIVLGDRTLFDSANGIDLPPRARRIGYVFQQLALFPHLDVAANIAFGVDTSRAEAAAQVEELLALVGLPGFGPRRTRALSGGEQQRVALARALAPAPEVLLLDEPLSALDARTRRKLRAELRRIHDSTGVPMVLVTHSQGEMRELSDWIVLYEAGRVLRSGPAAEVLGDPGSPEAVELLADSLA